MNLTQQKPSIFTLFFLASIVFFCTCNNEGSFQQKPVKVPLVKEVKTAKPKADTSTQLKFTSMVRSILEDSKGNFWFGSDREGVCRFDGKSFTYFDTRNGLCHNQIRTIQEDEAGKIWFATGFGVCAYDGEQFTTFTDHLPISNIINAAGWKKGAKDLWFNGEQHGGIYRYDGQDFSLLEFPVLDPNHPSFSITGTVTGICKGKNDRLWMANYGGVLGYDGKDFAFINDRSFDYHVRGIFEDSKGNLWIGNNGIGVLCYDGKKTVRLNEKEGLRANAPNQFPYHVFSIAEDRHGNIWIGDRDTGAWCYDGEKLINYTAKDGLPNRFVRVIYKDKKGDLWLGMEDGKVCKFNGKSFDKL